MAARQKDKFLGIVGMKVALVHDYLIEFGGAERVLLALHEAFPYSPVYTSFYRPDNFSHLKNWIPEDRIIPAGFNRYSLLHKLVSPLRFAAPWYFENLDLSDYDLVISSANTYSAKAVVVRPGTRHLSYIHTPPRALYGYDKNARWRRSSWKKVLAAPLVSALRMHDYFSAQRPDVLIANSQETRRRIEKFYRRDAPVIYPPVSVDDIIEATKEIDGHRSYLLTIGRFLPPKRIDLAVKACTELNLPLKVVGGGIEEARLRSLAGETIDFMGTVSDDILWELYAQARAVLFTAQEEDFGIVPVEAMAAGRPVLALGQGGVLESVEEGKTGMFFQKPTTESLTTALQRFDWRDYDPDVCRDQARRFSKERFVERIQRLIED